MRHLLPATASVCLAALLAALPARALDEAHAAKAREAAQKGVAWLKAHQDAQGSWGEIGAEDEPKMKNPGVVGVTGLALAALLDQGVAHDDPTVRKAVAFLLSRAKPTGEIGDGALQNYNTAIALSALARLKDDAEVKAKVTRAVGQGRDFLVAHQWQEGMRDPAGKEITKDHPFYGGAGYGGHHSRPDMSNTQFMLQAMHDSGMDADNPAMKRALVFLQKNQGIAENKEFGGRIENDGGFIYTTSVEGSPELGLIGVPLSEASPELIDEARKGNRGVSGLRTYGSMTYAGFKSYLYAKLPHDDPRVKAAYGWIQRNYTLDANPGLPFDAKEKTHLGGLYYYYVTFGRALHAWGPATLETIAKDGSKKTVDWQNDLTDKLAGMQKADGSWTNEADRWLESDPRLVTAYALIALNNALGLEK